MVTLMGGQAVSISALRLAWALEAKGCRFTLADSGALLVAPGDLLTPDDRRAIEALKAELAALVAYAEAWNGTAAS